MPDTRNPHALPAVARWALRQTLGSKRGEAVISLVESGLLDTVLALVAAVKSRKLLAIAAAVEELERAGKG